eukprot:Phypoly_transcript_08887.p1 GENE.Phypoly_transcript_08887~~Phypoly_transcript_08887.p1  ORF type:complete len:468 (+),score=54.14 Phypoly_transcript_08887:189-1406(+)
MAMSYKLAPNSSSNIAGVFQSIVGTTPESKDRVFPTSGLFARSPQPTRSAPPSASAAPLRRSTAPLSGEFCIVCGDRFNLLNKKGNCGMCELAHCMKCLLKLTNKDDTCGIPVAENEVFLCCNRCRLIFVHNTKHQAFLDMVKKSQAQDIPTIYTQMQSTKTNLLKILPNYEYLAMSIVDPQASSASNADTFFKVYEDVIQLQQQVLTLFHQFEKDLKILTNVNSHSKSNTTVKNNVKMCALEFLQTEFPKFKGLHKKILQIESSTATNMYFVLARAAIDNKSNTNFWAKFGKYYVEIVQIAKNDMQKAVLAAGDNWEAHKKNAEDLIVTWEPANKKSNSILNLLQPPDKAFEGTLIRKNIGVLRGALSQMEHKIGSNSLILTKTAVTNLIGILNTSYSQSLSLE